MHVEANCSAARAYIGEMPARLFVCVLTLTLCLAAFGAEPNPTFHITRATGPITIDGKLDDEAWKTATRIDQWWETNVAENGPPPAKSVGWLTYDDHFFYAAFQFDDPKPSEIRGPLNDRDHIGGNTDDYGGVIIDARNDGKTGILFLTNASGVQYDSVSDDSTGNEDQSPDFFWDSATRLTPTGWTLEVRIPFSSLRYASRNPAEWGIMLYRNYPRDRRYQMFANKIPRGNNCFICNENKLTGLENLPPGGHSDWARGPCDVERSGWAPRQTQPGRRVSVRTQRKRRTGISPIYARAAEQLASTCMRCNMQCFHDLARRKNFV